MAAAFAAALCFGFALWTYGRAMGAGRPWPWRTAAATALVATVLVGATVEGPEPETVPASAGAADSDSHAGTLGLLQLERFSPERMVGYIDSRQPLFVYFTADWCINCKVNERVALSTDEVGEAFAEKNIKVLVGDWTNEDPVITEWLQRYGRAGVPLYLYFPAGGSLEDAAILPQVLLPETVIQSIERADVLQRFGSLDTLS